MNLSAPEGFRLVPLTAERYTEFCDPAQWAFAMPPAESAIFTDLPEAIDWSRAVGIEEISSSRVVASSAAWTFDTPVPGGRIKAGGLTWVGVRPDFRRRGCLRTMIMHHFADCLAREQAVSLLTASEPEIYPRFGYGKANWVAQVVLAKGAALREIADAGNVTVEFATASLAAHGKLTADLHQQACNSGAVRPGFTPDATKGRAAWRFSDVVADPLAEPLRLAIVRRDGQPSGFATFQRVTQLNNGDHVSRECRVYELVALDPASRRALWQALTSFDLVARTVTPPLALDDPLFSLLVNHRQVSQPQITDDLWVRLVDLPAALAARRYACPVDLVLEVRDPVLPDNQGCWHLVGSPSTATVRRVNQDRGDVVIETRDLATLYLGGGSAASLFDAGLITEHRSGALAELAAALRWLRLPGQSRGF
jgi:predicted acetyltransferase